MERLEKIPHFFDDNLLKQMEEGLLQSKQALMFLRIANSDNKQCRNTSPTQRVQIHLTLLLFQLVYLLVIRFC